MIEHSRTCTCIIGYFKKRIAEISNRNMSWIFMYKMSCLSKNWEMVSLPLPNSGHHPPIHQCLLPTQRNPETKKASVK